MDRKLMGNSHKIIDGKKQAQAVLNEVRTRVIRLKELGWQPRLVSIDIGESSAVSLYIANQKRACEQVGIDFEYRQYRLRRCEPGSLHIAGFRGIVALHRT